MKVGSLFAGIGGFDLAARWMGWETAWYSEIDPYASAVMAHHFPTAVNHGDITKIDGYNVEHVDLLCGGFPCQDISLAGKGAGLAGARSGLWSHYARLIEEIRPAWVVIENVSALRSRGLDTVLSDLDALLYRMRGDCIPATYVGANHQRDRAWLVAYSDAIHRWPKYQLSGSKGARARDEPSGSGTEIPDSVREGLEGQREVASGADAQLYDPRDNRWWSVEPNVGRVANGVPSRVDRLKCLGNAIVPQVAYEIFQAIERSRTVVAA